MTPPELSRLRDEIERLDRQLIQVMANRVQLARQVGAAKRAAGLPTLDQAREAAVVRRAVAIARELSLPCDEDIRQIFWLVIGLSRRARTEDD
jgi:chorismate mutase/prephenate dehydrogenase